MTARKKEHPDSGLPARPIRTAVLRGLAVVLPPLLTIVIFIWVFGTVQQYVLEPFTAGLREVVVWSIADIRTDDDFPPQYRGSLTPIKDGIVYQQVKNSEKKKKSYIPLSVYDYVQEHRRVDSMPATAKDIYRRYVGLRYLRPYQVIPYFLCGFILVLYLLGKFMAAGVGRFFWGMFERGITRVPFVRKVYSSVKQVSDFLLTDREVQYSRVVAVEWPRKGIWCLALVTGSGLKEIHTAAGEEVLSVLIPTSPAPMTGFTVTVKQSETIDLDITIDEAIQYIVSCGVVVPSEHVRRTQVASTDRPKLVAAGGPSKSNSGKA